MLQTRLHSERQSRTPRNGAILFAALTCLLIVIMILGTSLKGLMLTQRALRSERDLRQTELLLDAGVAKAIRQINADSDYDGETWKLAADDVAGFAPAAITIAKEKSTGSAEARFTVTVDYPIGNETSIRRSRTFTHQSTLSLGE